jgi:2-oxoglutarate ferredoxin oxidoreductase subunit beta
MNPTTETNRLGLSKADYVGSKSTLCVGCGHDSITAHIITAFYQSSINPYHVAKLSGIGC